MGLKGKEIILLAALMLAGAPASAQNGGQKDSLVRLIKARELQLMEVNGHPSRRTVDATFMHNGTYLICDTAIWHVDEKVINAWGHVKVVQDETILTSEKMDYLVEEDLVQCRGGIVQLEDSKHNTLRTHFLDYNTRDSVATFTKGGAMRDSEGQIIESTKGTYDARAKVFSFIDDVNMYTDSIFIRTQVLDYESAPNRAVFNAPIDFWKDGNMMSASRGWYLRPEETFFFTGEVHATSEDQEAWSDSLYFYRIPNDILLLGAAQVQDSSRNVAALANRIYYTDSLSQVELTDQAAFALRTSQEVNKYDGDGNVTGKVTRVDTLYLGADRMTYRTIPFCLVPTSDTVAAAARLSEILTDPVMEYRRKAAQAAAEAAAKAAQEKAEREGRPGANNSPAAPSARGKSGAPAGPPAAPSAPSAPSASGAPAAQSAPVAPGAPTTPAGPASPESRSAPGAPAAPASPAADSTAGPDTLAAALSDSLLRAGIPVLRDSSVAAVNPADSVMTDPADTLSAADSLALLPPPDSTKIGFFQAIGNVRAFRYDLQMRCDSLRYSDLDSIARLYIDPVVWNDGNRQYTADSLLALVRDNAVDRVSLQGNAFIVTQEALSLFDQIKGTEVMAYFDSTAALRRFDALGGATALFFLKEKEEIATVNRVETKMLSAWFNDGDLDRVFYFDSPKNDVFPLAQVKTVDRSLKGFSWRPDEKPQGREDITTLTLRPSEREAYEARPRTTFRQTDRYFPGYMAGVYKAIEEGKMPRQGTQGGTGSGSSGTLIQAPDEVSPADTAGFSPADSVSLGDSLAINASDSLALRDSLAVNPADSPAGRDSVSLGAGAPLTASELRAAEKAARKARRDSLQAARVAAREARWADLDARDALKAAEKQARKDARAKARLEKQLERQRRQDIADEAKLQKYIERYRRRKAREDARAAAKAARKAASQPASSPDTSVQPKDTIDNGTDLEPFSPLHGVGHPEQRGLPKPAFDTKTAESPETPLPGAE